MKLGLVVVAGDQKRKVVVHFADFVKFEETFNVPMSSIESNLQTRHLAWFAWHSEKRAGKTTLDFDGWCATVDGILLDSEDEKLGPLESTPPTG